MPALSFSTKARYVTQQGVWSNQFLGALTNRRITYYAKQGRYGPEAQARALASKPLRNAKLQTKHSAASLRRKLLDDLLS